MDPQPQRNCLHKSIGKSKARNACEEESLDEDCGVLLGTVFGLGLDLELGLDMGGCLGLRVWLNGSDIIN